jgi:chromosome partitioning protein
MGRVIAVANAKGGIGKTTTVVNIGAGLALKGARVLLVDVDTQANLSLALGVRPRRTLYDVLMDGVMAAECVAPARPGLDLLAADEGLLAVQPAIARRPDWARALDLTLRPLYAAYDFVLLDSGGSLTTLNTNALACATDVLVPTAVEHFSLKSIDLLFGQVARVKGNSSSVRLIIPTMFDPRVRQSGELLDRLRSRYGALVAPPIRVNVRLSEAPTLGKTIYEYDPRSRGAVDYALLVERISTMFGFRSHAGNGALALERPEQARRPASQNAGAASRVEGPGSPAPARPAPPATMAPAVPPATSAAPSAAPTANDEPAPWYKSLSGPQRCPNCDHPLQFATLAGYRVAFCENCKYKTQTLAQGPRR